MTPHKIVLLEIFHYCHPEPVTNDDEFELLLSRSKFFKFILVGFVLQFLRTSEFFTFL